MKPLSSRLLKGATGSGGEKAIGVWAACPVDKAGPPGPRPVLLRWGAGAKLEAQACSLAGGWGSVLSPRMESVP